MGDVSKYVPGGGTRLRDVELVQPICFGTVAQFLGKKKKATDYVTHKWTVYVRGPHNEDLSHIISRVTFNLHVSFQNPSRVVERQPFELSETGWGEFDIGVVLSFTPDAQERDLELVHRLKLYGDEDTQMLGKPALVCSEEYDELVFSEPHEAFYQRVRATPPRAGPPLSVVHLLQAPTGREELTALMTARQRVAATMANIAQQEAALDAEVGPPSGAATPHAYA